LPFPEGPGPGDELLGNHVVGVGVPIGRLRLPQLSQQRVAFRIEGLKGRFTSRASGNMLGHSGKSRLGKLAIEKFGKLPWIRALGGVH
jgi:hypothetical protein